MHFVNVLCAHRFHSRVHSKLRKTDICRRHGQIRACHKPYRAAATHVGVVAVVLILNARFVENGLDDCARQSVRCVVDVVLDHDAFVEIHSLFGIHFFGEGRVYRVGVVYGKNKTVFACGHKVVFVLAERAGYLSQHSFKQSGVCALLGFASDFFVVETACDSNIFRRAIAKSKQRSVYACQIVYARRRNKFSVCAVFVRFGGRHDVKVCVNHVIARECGIHVLGIAQKRQHILLHAYRKTVVDSGVVVYRKGRYRDEVVAFDHFLNEFAVVFFDDSACDLQGRVNKRIKNRSAVFFHVNALAFARVNEFVALDVQRRRVRVASCDVEGKIVAHNKRYHARSVLGDVIFSAFLKFPRIRKIKLAKSVLFKNENAVSHRMVRRV